MTTVPLQLEQERGSRNRVRLGADAKPSPIKDRQHGECVTIRLPKDWYLSAVVNYVKILSVALFRWIAAMNKENLLRHLESCLDKAGMEIEQEYSNSASIYARDKEGSKTPINARVTVLISPSNGKNDEFHLEVRSSEPMLKRGTRCEEIANQIKAMIPAK